MVYRQLLGFQPISHKSGKSILLKQKKRGKLINLIHLRNQPFRLMKYNYRYSNLGLDIVQQKLSTT